MCCSAAAYNNKMKRPVRKCNVSGNQLGNPNVICKQIVMSKVVKLVTNNCTKHLKNINQYNVHSAWFDVDYGGCKYGIFSAAMPIEPLHSLENGIFSQCLDFLFNNAMTLPERTKLDDLAKMMTNWDRQYYLSSGAQKSMPTLLWKSGIASITNTEAKHKVGIMLTIIVLTLTEEGKAFFDKVLLEP